MTVTVNWKHTIIYIYISCTIASTQPVCAFVFTSHDELRKTNLTVRLDFSLIGKSGTEQKTSVRPFN